MQHDSARSLKLHVLFTVRRSLKVSEPCPYPPSSNPRPASRSRTCDLRSTADAIPSRARRATLSRSRRTSSRTGTTFFARSSATGTRALASGSESPLEPVGNDHWEGRFEASTLGRWQFTIEAWVDRYATLLDELDRKLAAGQSDLSSELSEAEALFGPGSGRRLARGRAQARREGPARQDVARASARGRRRAGARPLRSVVRALPAQLGRVQGRPEGAPAARRARLRRDLPAAHPSDRDDEPQGAEQRTHGREGRSGEPVGDRRAGGRPRCDPPRAGHAEGLRPARRGGAEARARDRARLRDPVLTRPPVAEGASGVVQPAAGRDAQVRREPAQALPGHLQRQLRLGGLARSVGGAAGRRPPLVPPRRAGLPRRQSAHEVGAVLGVADPRGARRVSRHGLLRRGLHAAGDDDHAREDRLQPVVHLLHVEEHEGRAHGVPADAARAGRRSTGRTSS